MTLPMSAMIELWWRDVLSAQYNAGDAIRVQLLPGSQAMISWGNDEHLALDEIFRRWPS